MNRSMHYCYALYRRISILLLIGIFVIGNLTAQTDADAIMMAKNNFCTGLMYNNNQWSDYWEGTLKRNNENLGTVSANMYAVMGNYGISDKLNVLFGLPFVQTKASAGTLKGLNGLQDLSLWVKWNPIEKTIGKGTLSVYGIGGLSFPTSNYVPDFLPLSIGLHSTNLSLRGMIDYQVGNIFATASGTYILRSNVTIDRTSYYTTHLLHTNEVSMPDVSNYQLRAGYRSGRMILEGIFNCSNTLGGFDITRNNMPFLSNEMDATTVGINLKYNIKSVDGLSLIGGGSITTAGRNVGKTNSINTGVFYILDFTKKEKTKPTQVQQ